MAFVRTGGVLVYTGEDKPGATAVHLLDASGNTLTIGGSGGTSSTDDGAFTAAASSITPVGGFVTSDSVDAGDTGAFAMLANRQQKITLYDSSGNEITSFGGGTQYTEDAAAAANPVGNALILVRADTPAGRTTTDGDNVAATGTDKGELYVKHTDSVAVTNAGLTALNGAIAGTEVQVDVVTSALPSGAATEATLDARTGALTETAPVTDTASSGLNGRLQRIAQRLTSLIALLPTSLGAGGGLKVDGSGTALPVSGTVTANIGTGTLAAVTTVSTVTNLSQLGGTAVAMNTGTRSAGTQRVTVATDDVVQTAGTVAEDQVLSGNPIRNGARASTAIPSAMSADGDVVTLWADRNGALIAKPRPTATATLANVSGSASSVTLIASNTGRLGAIIVNDSSATCYLKYGSTASATSFTYLLQPGATWEMPPGAIYTGIITGVWTSASGAARVTELS